MGRNGQDEKVVIGNYKVRLVDEDGRLIKEIGVEVDEDQTATFKDGVKVVEVQALAEVLIASLKQDRELIRAAGLELGIDLGRVEALLVESEKAMRGGWKEE